MTPPIGTLWRLTTGGFDGESELDLYSHDYAKLRDPDGLHGSEIQPTRQTFDELVIMADPKQVLIAIEAMGDGTYFVCLGEEKRLVTVNEDGAVEVGEAYL